MTLQDLKDNKAEIIEIITDKVGAEKVKEVMTLMVDSIGCRSYDDMTVVNFTKAVIFDNNVTPYEKPFTPTWLQKGFDSQQDYERACLGGKWAVKSNWAI